MRPLAASLVLLFPLAVACAGGLGEGEPRATARESGLHQDECAEGDYRACSYAPFDPSHPSGSGGPGREERVEADPWMPDLDGDGGEPDELDPDEVEPEGG